MKKRLHRMALITWDVIGGDCLKCMAEQGLPEIMTRDEVLEAVCDADYMKMYGQDKEAYEYWKKLPTYDQKLDAIKDAFPCKKYGW